MALDLPSRYPGRFNPGDADYPQGSFKNRTAPGALDGSYLERDWANDKEGFFQRLMLEAGISANGVVDTALASQYYDALLQIIQASNADTVNAAIATVAAAGTIGLTAGAPNTSQLAISGTGVSINGFTVEANRFFVVKMTGASNTLVNSASLVTGRGANIPVVAGDTFLMRSTAENTVEILCGSFLIDRGLGSGQVYQNVTGSRSSGVTYTNTTGRTIEVVLTINTTTGADTFSIVVAGNTIYTGDPGISAGQFPIRFTVPAGATYVVTVITSIAAWWELR